MSEQKPRTYVGSGKKVSNYDLVNIALCMSDIPTGAVYEYKGKQYVNLTIGAKKATDNYGKTHSIWLNDFKPEKRQDRVEENPQPTKESDPEFPEEDINPEDIPF